MMVKILAMVGAAATALAAFMLFKNDGVDYNSEKVAEYREILLENSSLPFAVGINTNSLERDWSYDYAIKYLSDKATYENIKNQGFDHLRIPIDFRLIYSKETKTLDEAEMKKFDGILDLADACL